MSFCMLKPSNRAFSHLSNEVISFPVTSSALLSQKHLLLSSSSSPLAIFTLVLLEPSTGTSLEVGALALPGASGLHQSLFCPSSKCFLSLSLVEQFELALLSPHHFYPPHFIFFVDYITIRRDLLVYLRIM